MPHLRNRVTGVSTTTKVLAVKKVKKILTKMIKRMGAIPSLEVATHRNAGNTICGVPKESSILKAVGNVVSGKGQVLCLSA
jgi:hypothetical protein